MLQGTSCLVLLSYLECLRRSSWTSQNGRKISSPPKVDRIDWRLALNNWRLTVLILGYPRYCTATTLPDGTTVLNGGRSRRGKPRGPPGSRELQTALKGCDDPLFLDFIRRCLEWDPAARMTPNAALRHAWLRRRLPRPPQVNIDCNDGGTGLKCILFFRRLLKVPLALFRLPTPQVLATRARWTQ